MALTKEQWQVLEKQLSFPFGSIKLRCDGYEVSAYVEKGKGLKFAIMVYIDGVCRGAWLDGKDERCLKFFRGRKRYLWPEKMRVEARSMLRKRLPKVSREFYEGVTEKHFFSWVPYWPSANAFFRHIRKTCKQIEVID